MEHCTGFRGPPPPSGGGPAVRVPPPICDPGYGKVRLAGSVEGLSDDAGPSVGGMASPALGSSKGRQVALEITTRADGLDRSGSWEMLV